MYTFIYTRTCPIVSDTVSFELVRNIMFHLSIDDSCDYYVHIVFILTTTMYFFNRYVAVD